MEESRCLPIMAVAAERDAAAVGPVLLPAVVDVAEVIVVDDEGSRVLAAARALRLRAHRRDRSFVVRAAAEEGAVELQAKVTSKCFFRCRDRQGARGGGGHRALRESRPQDGGQLPRPVH